MKKNLKRTLAKVMAVALTVTLVGTATEADAAKKPKLSSKSVTVTKGKSKKVTIKNVKAKNVKKLTVKSANKKTVSVKKKGKTAFTVKGLKVSKKAIKVTATLKLKGKKKATKLTVKVKVKAATPAKTTTPSASTNPGTSAAPGTSNAPAPGTSNAPAPGTSNAPAPGTSDNPATQAPPSEQPTQTPEEVAVPEGDVYEIDLKKETVATLDKDTYRTDVEYGDDGSVTFTNAAEYNGGMVFDAKLDGKKVDLSGFKYVELNIKTTAESSLKGFNDASLWWNKVEIYEGNPTPVEDRVIYYDLTALEGAGLDLTAVDGFGIGFQGGSAGALVTLRSMKVMKEKPVAPVVIDTPPVELAVENADLTVGDTTEARVSVESATVEDVDWSVDTAAVEVAKDAEDATVATITAVKAGTATITAKVTAVREDKTFVIEKTATVSVVNPGEVIFTPTLTADEEEVTVGESATLTVAVDTGDIEDVQWSVDPEDGAEITVAADKKSAEVTSDVAGTVTVTAEVSVEGSSLKKTVSKEITFKAAKIEWTTAGQLGEKADYTVQGAAQYSEYCSVTLAKDVIAAAKANEKVVITVEYTLTNPGDAPVQIKIGNGEGYTSADNQYVTLDSLQDGAFELDLTKNGFDGEKDLSIMLQTTGTGESAFAGRFKWDSIKVGATSIDTLPAEGGFAGLAEYSETATLDLSSITNLDAFNTITIEYTATLNTAQLYASLHTTKGTFQYSDVAKTDGSAQRTLVLTLDETAKGRIQTILGDADAHGTLVLGLKVEKGTTLSSGDVNITKVTFE